MPAPIVLSTLTPETKKVVNPPAGQPVIATKAEFRDGSRPTSGPGSSNWLSHSQVSRAPAPLLRFTDLVNGPASGIGDGLGSGAIVTVWAQGIGDSQGTSKAHFTDFAGTKRECYVYYWKRADGELPGGPARLWSSHLMQEVAISIPAGSVDGAGTITLEVNGVTSNTLPFLVRAGSIYHVKSTGSDSNDGSWSSPFATPDYALNNTPDSSVIYIHDVDTGNSENPPVRALFWAAASSNDGSKTAHHCTAAYPNNHPKLIATKGAAGSSHTGWLISKLSFFCSNYLSVDSNDQPSGEVVSTSSRDTYCVNTTQWGRIIGNQMTDIIEGCASFQQGAIISGGTSAEGFKNVGNEIYEYGCFGSSKFHHTTYFKIRDVVTTQIETWESAFNFLWGNHAKNGIHNYDQPDASSGGLTTDMHIHHNVIAGQGGAGITVGCNTGWDINVFAENNILIDVGLAADWDGVNVDTSDGPANGAFNILDNTPDGFPSTVHIRNNLIFKYKNDGQTVGGDGALVFSGSNDQVDVRWNNNITVSDRDITFIGYSFQAENKLDNVTGGNNIWHYTGSSPSNALAPTWSQESYSTDPEISLDGAIATLAGSSVAKAASNASVPLYGHDLYGVPRPSTYTIGPVEAQ